MVAAPHPSADPASASTEEAERRVAPRKRVLKRAKLAFNNGFSTIDAIVRNISATGALLTIDEAVQVPPRFDLSIGGEAFRPARLVYREKLFAGIRFLDVDESEGLERPAASPAGTQAGTDSAPAAASGSPQASGASGDTRPGIRRIEPEILPDALVRQMRWRI